MASNDAFLNSCSSISENQAEYSILSSIYDECCGVIFLLELQNLNMVKYYYSDLVNMITQESKSFDIRLFSFSAENIKKVEKIKEVAGTSVKDEELMNIALERSRSNRTYILVRGANCLVLFYNGKIDTEFENKYADKQQLIEAESKKHTIEDLEIVFDLFHLERKHRGCDYIVGGKVSNTVSEQQLRNHLIEYLKKETKAIVIPELCTSYTNDEESVDISVIDKNQAVSIIEVKFFVQKGMFEDAEKHAHSLSRFRDGYKQLNKYCIHLDQDKYSLHSAFLYMFYAHSDAKETIKNKASEHYNGFISDPSCSIQFKHHYKATILDDMLEQKTSI